MGKTISFRLRKIDSDLEKAISAVDSEQLAELCRNGLRLMLGIKTVKTTQVVEKTIVIPSAQQQPIKATIGNAPPTPYKPKS